MDGDMLEQHLENLDRGLASVGRICSTLATQEGLDRLDRRLERVEQILPTLATKEELRTAITDAIAPLATKEEVRELRRHMDVLSESQRGDIQLLAEHLSVAMSKLADR